MKFKMEIYFEAKSRKKADRLFHHVCDFAKLYKPNLTGFLERIEEVPVVNADVKNDLPS